MNKTLLLIMCDFLLLNLLALTRWEKAEPTHTQLETAAPRSAAAAPMVNADMVELMRVSLEDEKTSREQLASQLASTQGTLGEREKNLAEASKEFDEARKDADEIKRLTGDARNALSFRVKDAGTAAAK